MTHLTVILNTMCDRSLLANLKKCTFARDRTNYLGHLVIVKGVQVGSKNVRKLKGLNQ